MGEFVCDGFDINSLNIRSGGLLVFEVPNNAAYLFFSQTPKSFNSGFNQAVREGQELVIAHRCNHTFEFTERFISVYYSYIRDEARSLRIIYTMFFEIGLLKKRVKGILFASKALSLS